MGDINTTKTSAERSKLWRQEHKEQYNVSKRNYYRKRRLHDPTFLKNFQENLELYCEEFGYKLVKIEEEPKQN